MTATNVYLDHNKLLTPKDTAKLLAISQRKLWGLTNAGNIPHIRIGKSVRYAVQDLKNWIDSKRVSQASETQTNAIHNPGKKP